jgi:hypothetical protein
MTKKLFEKLKKRKDEFLKRRPHRSFRITRRRDYKRSLKLPGYFKFTKEVKDILWKNRKTFLLLALIYAIVTVVAVGIASQDTYSTITSTLRTTSGDYFTGVWGSIGKASLLYITALTGGISASMTTVQQMCAVIVSMMVWLTTIWLLRNILAGHKVKVRDGLYSAGAPILPTFMILLLAVVQMLPLALALFGYSAAISTGLIASGGVAAMLFWLAAGLLALLSLYWITGSLFALVVVTLPGMYPYRAIKTAGDIVIGRRMRILLRFLWMLLTIVVSWAIIMIPVILFDGWIKGLWTAIEWVPIVPVSLLILSSLTIIWASSYVYLLYRKVIADESDPA